MPLPRAYHVMKGGELWRQTDDDFVFVAAFYSQAAAAGEARRLLDAQNAEAAPDVFDDRGTLIIRPR